MPFQITPKLNLPLTMLNMRTSPVLGGFDMEQTYATGYNGFSIYSLDVQPSVHALEAAEPVEAAVGPVLQEAVEQRRKRRQPAELPAPAQGLPLHQTHFSLQLPTQVEQGQDVQQV